MKKQKSNQNTTKETDLPVCRFSAEDCALLVSSCVEQIGVYVFSEEPDYLKVKMYGRDPSPKGGKQ